MYIYGILYMMYKSPYYVILKTSKGNGMNRKEKVIFIFNNICKIRLSTVCVYILSIAIMGLAPVMQLKVLEKIIEVLSKSIQGGLSESYIREGILLIIIEGILFIAISMIDNISELVNNSLILNIQYNTKTVIAKKMKLIELDFFDNPDLLDLYENCVTQVDSSITEMVNLITATATTVVGLGGYLSLIFGINKFAIIVILITTLPMMILKIRFKKRYYSFIIANTKSNRKKNYYFDVLTKKEYFKEQKLHNTTNFFLNKREVEYKQYYNKNLKINLRGCIESFIANLIGRSGAIVCIIWMFYNCIFGKLHIAKFTSVFYAIMSIQDSFEAVFNILSTSYESFLYFDLFFEFIEYDCINRYGEKELAQNENIQIEFLNVSFKYFGTEHYVLKDVNFKINGTGVFVVIGENGSGKSTIIKLLLRLYKPVNGKILINKIDLQEYKQSEIQRMFSPMFQDYNKYAMSLKENIVMSNLEKETLFYETMAEKKFSDINSISKSLPESFDTELTKLFDKKGVELSIGQWQRVAIARSIFKDGKVLVWDEPMASVDALSEKQMMDMIDVKRSSKTFIVISHNFDIAKIADNIIVLGAGKVIAEGTHEELMSNCVNYSSMYTK